MDKRPVIYLDNAASTRVCNAAAQAMAQAMQETYGNPGSPHPAGQAAACLLEDARAAVARTIGAHPAEVFFTSGGTEANNWALRLALRAGADQGRRHLVISAIEHPSVLETAAALEREGFSCTRVPPDGHGVVQPAAVEKALRDDTALASVMLANNETGAIQPVRAIGALCRQRGILLHTDAVQAVGKLPVDVADLSADLLSLSGHKFHGPKGVGALFCRRGVPPMAWMQGGGQERGLRPGTENLPGIAGMAAALEEWQAAGSRDAIHIKTLAARLEGGLREMDGCVIVAQGVPRAPGLVCACFAHANGDRMLARLYARGVCVSRGAACAGGAARPSHVLLAMGLPARLAQTAIRFSLSRYTTEDDIRYALDAVRACCRA